MEDKKFLRLEKKIRQLALGIEDFKNQQAKDEADRRERELRETKRAIAPYISDSFQLDSLSPVELKSRFISSKFPSMNLADKTDSFIDGAFQIALQALQEKQSETNEIINKLNQSIQTLGD